MLHLQSVFTFLFHFLLCSGPFFPENQCELKKRYHININNCNRLNQGVILSFRAVIYIHVQFSKKKKSHSLNNRLFCSHFPNFICHLLCKFKRTASKNKKAPNYTITMFAIWSVALCLQSKNVLSEPARSHGNLYIFYEVANSYEFVRPHSYKFIRFLLNRTYFTSCQFV